MWVAQPGTAPKPKLVKFDTHSILDSRLWTLDCLFFHPLKFTRYQTLFGVQDYLNINNLCLPSFTNSRFADFLKKWNINASDKILK